MRQYDLQMLAIYGFSLGQEGLAFVPSMLSMIDLLTSLTGPIVAIGACIACCIYLCWDAYLRAAKARNAPWSNQEEYRRLPLACIGGPFFSIGCFWIGWTARVRSLELESFP